MALRKVVYAAHETADGTSVPAISVQRVGRDVPESPNIGTYERERASVGAATIRCGTLLVGSTVRVQPSAAERMYPESSETISWELEGGRGTKDRVEHWAARIGIAPEHRGFLRVHVRQERTGFLGRVGVHTPRFDFLDMVTPYAFQGQGVGSALVSAVLAGAPDRAPVTFSAQQGSAIARWAERRGIEPVRVRAPELTVAGAFADRLGSNVSPDVPVHDFELTAGGLKGLLQAGEQDAWLTKPIEQIDDQDPRYLTSVPLPPVIRGDGLPGSRGYWRQG